MPYLTFEQCTDLDLRPGSILQGGLDLINSSAPHCEDANWEELESVGKCSSRTFRQALLTGLQESVNEGFEYELPIGEKCIPIRLHHLDRLSLSESLPQTSTSLRMDSAKRNFEHHSPIVAGNCNRYVSITDLGFYDHAVEIRKHTGCLERLNDFIHEQEELLLRVGLSRRHPAPDGREGYWIQVNGIYTFPDYQRHIRAHGDDGEDWEWTD